MHKLVHTVYTVLMAFDIAAARDHQRERRRYRRVCLDDLTKRAERDAQRILQMLIATYRPRRIYRWGSLTQTGQFREWSDIDIALEGLDDPLAGLRAADDAARMTSFPVDLVELDRIDPRHAAMIREEGELVYERE